MKLLLTSFGIDKDPQSPETDSSLFYQMPPINMRFLTYDTFTLDYAMLLLCDKLVIDESSYTKLQEFPNRLYSDVAETLRILKNEGFVDLVNFANILKDNQPLLQKMLDNDLKILDQWVYPLKESINIWDAFITNHETRLPKSFFNNFSVMRAPSQNWFERLIPHNSIKNSFYLMARLYEALESSRLRKKSEHRDILRIALSSYLSYVNANLILSHELEAGFHDWSDFLPFYNQKFLQIGIQEGNEQGKIEASRKLFEISFPEFAITDSKALVKVLQDKRIVNLRQLVQEAAEGKVSFDQKFARDVFKEILGVERQATKYRNIISYLTIPIDFLPWVGTIAQKATEEIGGVIIDKKLKQKYQWFYLLDEIQRGVKSQ